MKKKLLLKWQWLLVLALSGPALAAQNRCDLTLSGKVIDAHTQEPVAFANIAIQDSDIGAIADENGQYIIKNFVFLAAGWTVLVPHAFGSAQRRRTSPETNQPPPP